MNYTPSSSSIVTRKLLTAINAADILSMTPASKKDHSIKILSISVLKLLSISFGNYISTKKKYLVLNSLFSWPARMCCSNTCRQMSRPLWSSEMCCLKDKQCTNVHWLLLNNIILKLIILIILIINIFRSKYFGKCRL